MSSVVFRRISPSRFPYSQKFSIPLIHPSSCMLLIYSLIEVQVNINFFVTNKLEDQEWIFRLTLSKGRIQSNLKTKI
jgi:hypothetical protein